MTALSPHHRIALLATLLLLTLAACTPNNDDGSGTNDPAPTQDIARLDLTITPTTVEVGGAATVTVTGYDENDDAYENANVEWSSSDASTARVVDGTFEARSPGSATITATADEASTSVDVTIIEATDLADVAWEPSVPFMHRPLLGFTILADDTWIAQADELSEGTFTSRDEGDTWTRIGDGFTCVSSTEDTGLIAHPSDPNVVLGYCDLRVFRSEDGGLTWSEANVEAGVSTTNVKAPHPTYTGRAFHTWHSDDVVRYSTIASTDRGRTWHGIDYEYPIVDENDPTHWFATHEGGLYESTNAGDDWAEIPTNLDAGQIDIALDCAAPIDAKAATASTATGKSELFLVATQACDDDTLRNLTLKSSDAGATWNLIAQESVADEDGLFPDGSRLTANPNDPNNLHLTSTSAEASVSTLHVTTDGGANWSEVTHPHEARSMHYPPGDPNVAILVTHYDDADRSDEGGWAYISTDQGETWNSDHETGGLVCDAGNFHKGRHFVTTPEDPNIAYLGKCVTTDGGSTWAASTIPPSDVVDDTYAYATDFSDGIVRSDHRTPSEVEDDFAGLRGLGLSFGQKLFADVDHPTRLFSILDEELNDALNIGTLFTEDPTASKWATLGPAFAVAQAPSRPSRWYISVPDLFVVGNHLTDADSWSELTPPVAQVATKLVVSQQDHDLVYFASDDGVFKSLDAGSDWLEANHGLGTTTRILDLAIHPENDQILYAATPAGIYETTDGGDSWTDTGSDLDLAYDVTDLEFNADGSTVFAVAYRDGVYRRHTPDGPWERADEGLPTDLINDLDAAPNHPNIAYVATEEGVWRTGNRGSTWHAIGESLPYAPTLDLAVSDDGHRIYALTQDRSATTLTSTASGVGTDIFVGILDD